MKYIKSIWNSSGEFSYLDYYELGDGNFDKRKVCFYRDGKITAANEEGGYLGEEIGQKPFYESEKEWKEIKSDPEFVITEITKEEFEVEWNKAISQPGFELVPYKWLEN